MKIKSILRSIKVITGLSAFAFLLLNGIDYAKAESVSDLSKSDVNVKSSSEITDADMNAIVSALDGKQLKDGDSIMVDDKFRIDIKVTIKPVSDTLSESNTLNGTTSSLASATSSTTKTYTADCECRISTALSNVLAAVITHSLTVISYDTGKIHISYGSLSASAVSSSWTATAYGYSITNTDGSYSSAAGTARLYSKVLEKYAYYRCTASVTPGNTPSFSFTQY